MEFKKREAFPLCTVIESLQQIVTSELIASIATDPLAQDQEPSDSMATGKKEKEVERWAYLDDFLASARAATKPVPDTATDR